MFDGTREKMLKRALSQITPSETEQGEAAAEIIAGLEQEVADARNAVAEAADADLDRKLIGYQARKNGVGEVLDATADGKLLERAAERHGIDGDPDRLRRYSTLDPEDWEQQKHQWANEYRDRGVGGTDNEIADQHVREVFDCDLQTFEEVIVRANRGEWLTEELVKPTVEMTDEIEQLADELE